MAPTMHYYTWTWTICLIFGCFKYSFTAETAFVITTSPNKLYKVTLTGASHSVEEILDLGAAASGIVYNDFNDEIVWGEGGNIKTMPVTGSTPSTFAVSSTVQDVDVDSTTGDIIYNVGNTVYKMVAGGQSSQVKQEFMGIQSCTVDAPNRLIYYTKDSAAAAGVWYVKIDGTGSGTRQFSIPCKWLTFTDGILYWIDGGAIKGGAFATASDYALIYNAVVVVHFKVVANYIYAISTNTNLYKINLDDVSDVTTFNLGLNNMAFVAVFEGGAVQCPKIINNGQLSDSCLLDSEATCTSANCSYGYESSTSFSITCTGAGTWDADTSALCTEIFCPTSILNGQLPGGCGATVDESCNSYICDAGYHKDENVVSLMCTSSGDWNQNTSTLCLETLCATAILNGDLPQDCESRVNETCNEFTCINGYKRNEEVVNLTCTESGQWDSDPYELCIEIECERSVSNWLLPVDCGVTVNTTCDNFTCVSGYQPTQNVVTLQCMENGTWNLNPETLCEEIFCPGNITNGELPVTCGSHVNETCNNYTCSYGYHKTEHTLQCMETGMWNHDTATLCQETFCATNISNGDLPQDCDGRVDETCNDFTCIGGYKRNEGVVSLSCTESGQWSHDPGDVCIEIECPTSVSNWLLSADCGVAVNTTCDNFTCASGYHRTQNVVALQCMENGTWNLNTETLCEETFCSTTVANGQLPPDCLRKVGESCTSYTCDGGYKPNDNVDSLNCTESGDWNQNTSALCVGSVVAISNTPVFCLTGVPGIMNNRDAIINLDLTCQHINEIHCSVNVSNGNLSQSCGTLVGDTCNTYSCENGFKKNETVSILSCTGSGLWNHDLDALCVEIRCPQFIQNGALSNACGTNIGDSCGSFNCNRGFQKQVGTPLTCDETGTWTSNITQFCTEIVCPGTISNGLLPPDCNALVDENCSGYSCNSGYEKNPNTSSLTCMDTGSWNHEVSDLCTEILCPLAISNGNIASCANTVGAECKNYSCDQGFQKNGAVQSLTCSVSGSWTYDISIFCPALLTGVSCAVDIPDGQLTESSLQTIEDTCSVSFCNGTVKQSLLNSNIACLTTGTVVADSSTLCEGLCSTANNNMSYSENSTYPYACMSGQNAVHILNEVLLLVLLPGVIMYQLLM